MPYLIDEKQDEKIDENMEKKRSYLRKMLTYEVVIISFENFTTWLTEYSRGVFNTVIIQLKKFSILI